MTDWFHRAFVDGYDWVMVPNVVGMSQHADAGVMATKPYTSGGAYLNRMTDHCGSCRFDPGTRVGEDACPFTAGYWWFLDRNRERLAGNPRMTRALGGLDRLRDLDAWSPRRSAAARNRPDRSSRASTRAVRQSRRTGSRRAPSASSWPFRRRVARTRRPLPVRRTPSFARQRRRPTP